MADQTVIDILNHIVGCVYRSLLQYSIECSAWTTLTETAGQVTPEQQAVEQMAARQQDFVARLAELIFDRGGAVDYDTFNDNSELHYVALDFLVGKILEDELYVVGELESSLQKLSQDAEASALVGELLNAERAHVTKLRELSAKSPASA
ncbi:MAG: hypothetical protein JSS02_18395 [Planctomycetes bacterium]|nr:hypothetical protein [Planctomycetota bacterium]